MQHFSRYTEWVGEIMSAPKLPQGLFYFLDRGKKLLWAGPGIKSKIFLTGRGVTGIVVHKMNKVLARYRSKAWPQFRIEVTFGN